MTLKYTGLEHSVIQFNDLWLECWFEYEPAERGSRERRHRFTTRTGLPRTS